MIVTALFDDTAFARFDAERREHFPPERNFIPAHITLFHAIPDDAREHVTAIARTKVCVSATATALKLLGGGVAYVIDAPELVGMRSAMAAGQELTRQDAQPYRPHVTIQNKVTPETARALFASLERTFAPIPFTLRGVALWHYRGGPWELIEEIGFS